MKQQKGNGTIGALIVIAIFGFAILGWVMNIIRLAHTDFGHITGMLICRAIGIFIAPLGAVLGYF